MGATAAQPAPDPVPVSGYAAADDHWELEFRCSNAQERLWFLHRLEPDSPAYNVPVLLRLRGRLDVAGLERALGTVVARHETLRTTFRLTDAGVRQVVSAPRRVRLTVLPAEGPDPAEAARAIVAAELGRPFDLGTGPLLRPVLVRLTADDHVLAAIFHHIVFDEWSAGVFLHELGEAYRAAVTGTEPDLAELPIQYGDFAEWQRDTLDGGGLADQLGYWRRRLAGTTPLDLPTDRPRTADRGWAGDWAAVDLPDELAAGLRRLARDREASPFMVLLAAFTAVLARTAGQDDVVVGTTTAGRSRLETEGLIGFFVNAFALRTDVSGDPTFGDLLARVRDTTLGAFAHGGVPFERLVSELAPERDQGRHPVFSVVFGFLNAPGDSAGCGLPADRVTYAGGVWPGLTVEQFPIERPTALFDLRLVVSDSGTGLAGGLEYSTDLFDAATVDRLSRQLTRLLYAVVADPDRPVHRLPPLDPDERAAALVLGAGPARPAAPAVGDRIAALAATTPDVTAVLGAGGELSYRDLLDRADRLARHLHDLGVGPDSVVGVAVSPGPALGPVLLGVWRAGAAFLVVDPADGLGRIGTVLASAGVVLVVCEDALVDAVPVTVPRLVVVDDPADAAVIAACPADPPVRSPHPDSLAYVVATSGSTGVPKLVAVPHRALAGYVDGVLDRLEIAGLRCGYAGSLAADLGFTMLFCGLAGGGGVWLGDRDLATDPPRLGRELAAAEVDVVKLVPSLARVLPAGTLPGHVVLGGEASATGWIADLVAAGHRVTNHYGPSEATVGATTWAARPPWPATATGPIGRPLPNVRCYVLDRSGEPVPPGGVGELWLGGPGLARGYPGAPQLTAERFVADPFVTGRSDAGLSVTGRSVAGLSVAGRSVAGPSGAEGGGRLYRTGDKVRWLDDGRLEFLGRVDDQVKVRGYRIEPAEVEAVLARHPRVAAVAVAGRPDPAGGTRLVAWVVPAAGPGPGARPESVGNGRPGAGTEAGVPTIAELREFAAGRLPDHLRPAAVVPVASLPRLASGKVDKAALPDPPTTDGAGHDRVEPAGATEHLLAGIWAELLRIPRVGRTDDFFDLGGHSLLAIQAVTRVRQAFGVEVPVRDLFDHPTLAGFGAVVDRAAIALVPPVRPVPRTGPLPLSSAQHRLWFLDQLAPGSAEYNVPAALRLTGPLDVAALGAALGTVVARHEVLRTRFVAVDGMPQQVVDPPAGVDLPVLDLPADPSAADRAVAGLAAEPFDLARGPLLRARLLRLQPDDHVLVLVAHHIVSDQWSSDGLRRELLEVYRARLLGTEPRLPDLPVQYADFAVWQRDRLADGALDPHVGYWRDKLAGLTPLELPTDRPRPPVRGTTGGWVPVEVPAEAAAALRRVATGHGASTFMALLATFGALLARYSGQPDVAVGTPVAGRARAETEHLVGLFVNTLVLRTDLSGEPSFADLLARVRDTTLGALSHAEVPFERLVDEFAPQRDLSRTPLFQVMFSYEEADRDRPADPETGLAVADFPAPCVAARFDLTLSLTGGPDSIRGTFEYNTDLFCAATVERMAGAFTRLLDALIADPSAVPARLPLLGEADRAALARWNDTRVAEPGWLLPDRIAAQAAATPDATAVVFDGPAPNHAALNGLALDGAALDGPALDGPALNRAALSYAGLDARANRLAHRLADAGAGPGRVVAVCLPRSLDLMVALLAILRSGAAYLPLDPEYPGERLAALLDDARPVLLVTDRAVANGLPAVSVATMIVDGVSVDPVSATPLAVRIHPEDLAYVIYTSGSTGRPKGVMVSHRGIANRLAWLLAVGQVSAADRVLQKTPYTFDVSVWELFAPLLVGATVVLARPGGQADAAYLGEVMRAERVTVAHFVPSMLRAFLLADPPEAPADLRLLVCSGEALPADLARRAGERLGVTVHNLYGPTEASVDVTWWPVGPTEAGPPPIGRPIANTTCHVLDPHGNPVPVGAPGELYLGGVGLARGYLHRPDLTAERFVAEPHRAEPHCADPHRADPHRAELHRADPHRADPHRADPHRAGGARLYRTGDRARWRPDGVLEYLGRLDEQVKVRGYRVEPAEIEAALLAHPAVAAAAVRGWEPAPGDTRLVAHLVLNGDAELDVAALRAFCKDRLPDYLVPALFVEVAELPRTPNGKLDRAALPAPDGLRPRLRDRYEPPVTAAERDLAAVWADLLRVDRVGIADNFFELGGDSIIAIQVVARARRTGLVITPTQLFRHQTVRELAAVAEPVRSGVSAAGPDAAVDGPVPLTPIQRWFVARDLAEAHHFNQVRLVELPAGTDPDLLAATIRAVAAHHDALGLRYDPHAGVAVPGAAAPVVSSVDLSGADDAGGSGGPGVDEEAFAAAAIDTQRGLDPYRGRLLAGLHVTRGADRPALLLLAIHHLAVDALSWPILLDDLATAYRQLAAGEPVLLPTGTPYRTWAALLAEHAGSPQVAGELAHWLDAGQEPVPPLPVDSSGGPGNTVGSTDAIEVVLDERRTAALLRAVPAAYRASVPEVLLAVLVHAVAGWTGTDRVLVDVESHGREELRPGLDLSRSVGWFTALYPVLFAGAHPSDPVATLKAAKERLRAVPRQGLAYLLGRYGADEATAARLAARPAAEILFNYLGQLGGAAHPAGWRTVDGPTGPSMSPAGERAYLIEVNGGVRAGRLRMSWIYSRARHRRDTVAAVADRFAAALDDLIARAERAPATRSLAATPSDFPLAGLDQPALDRLLTAHPGPVEDVYPLSPMQQGMLFHTLLDPDSGVYVQQVVLTLEGELDEAALARAWTLVLDRCAVLRSAVAWRGLARPLHVVPGRVDLPLRRVDLADPDPAAAERRLADLLAADRTRGFDPGSAPLLRLTLARFGRRQHRLVLTYHHLLLDGWSLPQLLGDVFAGYQAFATGQQPELPRRRPYRDVVAWLERQDRSAAQAYWRRELAGQVRTALPGGLDRPGPAAPRRHHRTALTAGATRRLVSFGQEHRLTLGTLLQGAWALLLSRYGGERDVLFGMTVSGRGATVEGVESVIGLLINTVPVRVRLDPRSALLDWLGDLQAAQLDRGAFEHTSLVDVKAWAGLAADAALFDTLLIVENYPMTQVQPDQARLAVTGMDVTEQDNHPLAVVVAPGERLAVRLSYDPARIGDDAVRAVAGHLTRLLESIPGSADRPVTAVPILTAEELDRLRPVPSEADAWSGEWAPSVVEQVSRYAGRTPAAAAVVAGDRTVSYAELDARVDRLAARLRQHGVRPDVLVGVCLPRTDDLLVALLAVWRAGGGYLPLDPAQPAARLAGMLADAGARLVLTTTDLSALAGDGVDVLCVDRPPKVAGPAVAAEPGPDNLAYVIFTSGSTGRPKGVAVSRRSVENLLWSLATLVDADQADVWAAHTTVSFDIAALELFVPLLTGATVVLAPDGADPEALLALLRRHRVTVTQATPSLWRMLLDAGWTGAGADGRRRPVRVLCGGERLPAEVAAALYQRADAVWNVYGPTETTIWSTAQRLSGGEDVLIGVPLANQTCHVLDRYGQPVPTGAIGELAIGGAGVARGYLGRPDLTADRFVADPFDGHGGRLYRTGDRARWRVGGRLECLGRLDEQVKVRGFRVEPGEVEAVLAGHPAVRRAVVGVRDRVEGDQRLVAWVVPADPARPPGLDDLRGHLATALPGYMIPGTVVVVDEVPLTPNGKVDRAALPDPTPRRPALDTGYLPPTTATERALAELWCEVLGVDRVGVADSFFALGGHSLLVLRLAGAVRTAFDVDFALREVFDHPVLGELAERIETIVVESTMDLSEDEVRALLAADDRRLS